MKAYKIKETINGLPKKGRLLIEIDRTLLLIATQTEPQYFIDRDILSRLKDRDLVDEINLLEEKWVHPHLYSPLKKQVYET